MEQASRRTVCLCFAPFKPVYETSRVGQIGE
jgi:hypothetical protein